jgi:SAM-dependent methyltransferase
MHTTTIQRLNAINRAFYQTVADDFDQTRAAPWPGWTPLLRNLRAPLNVLDIGCGNARFAVFLAGHFGAEQVVYHGIDNSAALLAWARAHLAAIPGLRARLDEHDVVEQPLDLGTYDLVTLFGVLHHIPGAQERAQFMRAAAGCVKAGGLLVFTAWRFYEFERYRARVVPWPDDLRVEVGDYLLDWRRGAHSLRYCHYVDDAEQTALEAATGLTLVTRYRADGDENRANAYSVLRREQLRT